MSLSFVTRGNSRARLTETDAAIADKVRHYTYDAVGHLITAIDPLGVVTTYAYDARDRRISESTPMNATEVRLIRYGFDGRGNRITLTDANGAVTTWGYDAAGRQIAKTYANGDHSTMEYDALARLVKLLDENGHETTSTYDLAGRLTAKHFADDNTTDTYAYDLASRMTSVTKGRYAHTLAYGYDQAGRLATETHPDGTVLHLAYDDANRLANLSLNDGAAYSVAYAFNSNGQLSTVTAGDYATRYEYRANGQLASTVDYRVIDPQADILRADRSYDTGARLTEVANTAANGDQAGVRYTLALDDQRTEAVEESGAKWQYGYDNLKQLVTAKKTDTQATVIPPLDQSYAYDPMGNRRTYADQTGSTAYTANNANQYTAVGGVASVYDHNGNLLTDGVKNYTWDAENQLTSVTPVNPTEGSAKVEYSYDWRMRRTGKKSYTYTAGNWTLSKTTGFKYHEWNLIDETVTDFTTPSSPLTTAKQYVWGNDLSGDLHGAGGVGGLLSMKYTGENYFYAYDGNGNVRALVKADTTNPAASGVTARYTYDGFGKEVAVSGADADKNIFRFSTKQLGAETGMNYYGYRYYAAVVGRWVNRDPIEEQGDLNIYSFAKNSAILSYDILGHLGEDSRPPGTPGPSGEDFLRLATVESNNFKACPCEVSYNNSERIDFSTNKGNTFASLSIAASGYDRGISGGIGTTCKFTNSMMISDILIPYYGKLNFDTADSVIQGRLPQLSGPEGWSCSAKLEIRSGNGNAFVSYTCERKEDKKYDRIEVGYSINF